MSEMNIPHRHGSCPGSVGIVADDRNEYERAYYEIWREGDESVANGVRC